MPHTSSLAGNDALMGLTLSAACNLAVDRAPFFGGIAVRGFTVLNHAI